MAVKAAGGGNLCGTIHHSDRGSQYACHLYVETLMCHHIRVSMTERYNPTDNPVAERTNGTFKVEWIYQQEMYRDYDQANMEKSLEKEINACKKEKYNVSLERRKYGERRSYAIFTKGPRGHRAP